MRNGESRVKMYMSSDKIEHMFTFVLSTAVQLQK